MPCQHKNTETFSNIAYIKITCKDCGEVLKEKDNRNMPNPLSEEELNKKLKEVWDSGSDLPVIREPINGDLRCIGGFTTKAKKFFKYKDGEWEFAYEMNNNGEIIKGELNA